MKLDILLQTSRKTFVRSGRNGNLIVLSSPLSLTIYHNQYTLHQHQVIMRLSHRRPPRPFETCSLDGDFPTARMATYLSFSKQGSTTTNLNTSRHREGVLQRKTSTEHYRNLARPINRTYVWLRIRLISITPDFR